jgi:polysaccharide biosynthesis/export protein
MTNDLRVNLDTENRAKNCCVAHWFGVGLRFVTILSTLTLFVFSISCQTPVSHTLPEQSTPPTRVTLASGDVIKLIFAGAPELNQSQKIRADGKISLPQVGEVTAAGKTLSQFQSELVALYGAQLRNSDILVTLESGATRVYMAGAVARPGPLVLDRPTTVLQAIMQAGGPNQFGNMRRVQIIRLVNGREQTQVLDLQPTLAGHTTQPFYVRDGDVISVGQKAF